MDIKVMPTGRPEETFTFPSLPDEVKGVADTRYHTYTVISKGNILVPKGLETNEFRWSGEFFGEPKKNEHMVKPDYWQEPVACVDILRKWMDTNTVLNLVVTDTWINQDVTIAAFSPCAYGGFGSIKYDIVFKVYKNLEIYTTGELGMSSLADLLKIHVGGRSPQLELSGTTYEIKENETLWTIAIKVYGDGSLWEDIWKKNKKVLNKAAKAAGYKNADKGYRIVPGTTITLP